jgi:hypothetical protein
LETIKEGLLKDLFILFSKKLPSGRKLRMRKGLGKPQLPDDHHSVIFVPKVLEYLTEKHF